MVTASTVSFLFNSIEQKQKHEIKFLCVFIVKVESSFYLMQVDRLHGQCVSYQLYNR